MSQMCQVYLGADSQICSIRFKNYGEIKYFYSTRFFNSDYFF